MCGIAGVINYHKYDLEKVKRSLIHRGPDDQTIYHFKNLALVHTRLSIQDIRHGSQPMHFGKYTIIFNGEIYNHLELRQYLDEFNFVSQSDTETLLYLYAKFKLEIFDLLDGMYAFAILDKTDNTLIIARDRSGKKPLYYFHDGLDFMFASELNALKSLKKLEINEDSINSFLRNGFFCDSLTPYTGVKELSAGHYLKIELTSLTTQQQSHFDILHYYRKPKETLSLKEATEKVDFLLIKSVKNRLLSSDLEVGAFLSGGIDSNLIVSVAANINPHLKTFTVKVPGDNDESAYARLTAERYNTNHFEININFTDNLNNDIEKILGNYGEPFADSSAIPSYYVAKAASQYVKVILNGDGADELFAGYRRYVPFANNWLTFAKHFAWVNYFLPRVNQRSMGGFLSRLLRLSTKSGLDLYLSATSDIFEDIYKFPDNIVMREQDNSLIEILNDGHLSSLSKMMYLDFTSLFCNALLVKMDIATMANSVEGRSPFLSKYFLEFAPTLSDHFKINQFTTKFILRNLARKYLDTRLVSLPKRGFEVPLQNIVDNILYDRIRDYFTGDCYVNKYIDRSFMKALLDNKIKVPNSKRTKMIWSLFCIEVWYRNDQKNFNYC